VKGPVGRRIPAIVGARALACAAWPGLVALAVRFRARAAYPQMTATCSTDHEHISASARQRDRYAAPSAMPKANARIRASPRRG
jgi:hypothetical protein